MSGLDAKSASLVYLSPAEGTPTWLTGGDFGTEGSLPAAALVLIGTAVAYLLSRRSSRTWPDAPTTQAADDTQSAAE